MLLSFGAGARMASRLFEASAGLDASANLALDLSYTGEFTASTATNQLQAGIMGAFQGIRQIGLEVLTFVTYRALRFAFPALSDGLRALLAIS